MAANKFATILHRNTNKITLILIYALLEWILILLLLLNSLLSYLIIKFAQFFGLQHPCLWCTRLDHIFDPQKDNKKMHGDLLCEVHAREISKLGYCLSQHKLAESQDMCAPCLTSRPEFQGFSKFFSLFPWIKEFGVIQDLKEEVGGENGEVSVKCSCCGLRSDNTMYSSYILLKTSSWDVLECAQKDNFITKDGDLYDNHIQEGCDSDKKISDFSADLCDEEKVLEDKNESEMLCELDENVELTEKERKENGSIIPIFVNEMKELEGGGDEQGDEVLEMEEKNETVDEKATFIMKDKCVRACVGEDSPVEISPQHLEFFLDYSGHNLVPVELIDLITVESRSKDNVKIEDHDKVTRDQDSSKVCEVDVEEEEYLVVKKRSRLDEMEVVLDLDINEEPKCAMLDSMELEAVVNSQVFHAKNCNLAMEEFQLFTNFPVGQLPSEDVRDVQEMAVAAREMHLDVHAELARVGYNENEAHVSIGTDIPDLDITSEIENQESVHSSECTHEDPSTSSANHDEADDHGSMQVKEQMVELDHVSVQYREHILNNQPSFELELNEIEEGKMPDTPPSMDGLNQLHNKLGFQEKRNSEESLDGSVTGELEGSDGAVTIEGLKTALRAERENLQALYAELEEERSASAVAASQSMTMINRLQEEKAAIQMEALQYERMMEEQCEYDQEALQLMNELMVKREKEKQELEKELEVYRKELLHYETKEKIRVSKKRNGSSRSEFSSASCGNADEGDGLSIDLNQEAEEEKGPYSHEESGNHHIPVDMVMNLEGFLADFEEERLSILAELKVSEEKLMLLDDGKELQFEDVKAVGHFPEENGSHEDENAHFNGDANGFVKERNRKHHQQRRIECQNGKSLLPLFDGISKDMLPNGNGNGFDLNGGNNSHESKSEMENRKLGIEEEVDHLYERLQALEADREFIKHCVSSLKKGDRGKELLEEILEHLRDLRYIELQARDLSHNALIYEKCTAAKRTVGSSSELECTLLQLCRFD